MKHLPLTSPAFKYVEKSFGEWLDVLGYAPFTVYEMPIQIRGLLHYLEQQGKTSLKDITKEQIKNYYYTVLKHRPNHRKGGALSSGRLNKHIQTFNKFCDYLRQSGRQTIPALHIQQEENDSKTPAVLTEEEVKALYKACDDYPARSRYKSEWLYEILALRDKAMLTIYYGCGLRRNEGIHIELNDIWWEKQLLHVKKGKNYKERFVPISKSGIKHLERYLYDARPMLLRERRSDSFFINERGKTLSGAMMLLRLDLLIERTQNPRLQEKEAGLHTLRHSIATHLLGNGMNMEKIKDFLGHASLESTQIYTHLLEIETK
jgi:integrase/recombinase XerD